MAQLVAWEEAYALEALLAPCLALFCSLMASDTSASSTASSQPCRPDGKDSVSN